MILKKVADDLKEYRKWGGGKRMEEYSQGGVTFRDMGSYWGLWTCARPCFLSAQENKLTSTQPPAQSPQP